ncbi:MAG: DUF370 domain-containing protein [Oscillospiraceae bacterium]|nr:DUF370 domain-containing protein [Oscillospiraceae bacterium]
MYLHIGGDAVLQTDEIIGIFDFDSASRGRGTLDFLKRREKSGRLIQSHGDAMPRSFTLTASDMVYISPVTTETLHKRLTPSAHQALETEKKAWIR